jgi:hypothetical protein
MDVSEIDAENALVAELVHMARALQTELHTGVSLTVWKQRREQIAALRQRVRSMRDRHLGVPAARQAHGEGQ